MDNISDREIRRLFREYYKNLGYSQEAITGTMHVLTITEMKIQLINAGYINICGGRVYRY